MKSQRLHVMVAVRLVSVVMFLCGMFLVVLSPFSFAQSEKETENLDQETPEVEVFQNAAGEWKVRYLNAQADSGAGADAKEAASIDVNDVEANTDVELYQDASGEWKVRYVPVKKSVPAEPSVKKYEKEPESDAAVSADVAVQAKTKPTKSASVVTTEATERKSDNKVGEQNKEQLNSSVKTQEPQPVSAAKVPHATQKEVSAPDAAVAPAAAKSVQSLQSADSVEKAPVKKAENKLSQELQNKQSDDEFSELTEKIESSLTSDIQDDAQRPSLPQVQKTNQPSNEDLSADKALLHKASEKKPVVANNAGSVKENRAVPMDQNELKKTVGPGSSTPVIYLEEIRPINSKGDVYMPAKSFRNPHHQIELGLETLQYQFDQESLVNNLGFGVAKKNEGMLYGLHGGYEYVSNYPEKQSFMDFIKSIDDVNRYKFTVDYTTGAVEYSDKNFDGLEEDFNHHLIEARAVAGYDFRLIENTRFTPFMGLGYRYQLDPSGTIIDAPPGTLQEAGTTNTFTTVGFDLRQPYEVQTHYLYLPLGVMTTTDITDSWSLGVNLEADVVFWGMIRNSFSDLGTLYVEDGVADPRTLKYRDTTNSLRGGIGFRGSTRLTKKQNNFDWYIEPFIRYWHINKSEKEQYPLKVSDGKDVVLAHGDGTPYTWVEPESSTTEYGLQVGVVY